MAMDKNDDDDTLNQIEWSYYTLKHNTIRYSVFITYHMHIKIAAAIHSAKAISINFYCLESGADKKEKWHYTFYM